MVLQASPPPISSALACLRLSLAGLLAQWFPPPSPKVSKCSARVEMNIQLSACFCPRNDVFGSWPWASSLKPPHHLVPRRPRECQRTRWFSQRWSSSSSSSASSSASSSLSSRSPVSATRAALVHHVPSEGPRALLSGSPRPPTPGLGATSLRNCLLRPPMHRRSCIELGGANCLSGFRTVFPPLATLIEVRKIGERGIRSLDLMRETEGLLQRGQPGERVVGGGLSTYEARREEFIYWLNE